MPLSTDKLASAGLPYSAPRWFLTCVFISCVFFLHSAAVGNREIPGARACRALHTLPFDPEGFPCRSPAAEAAFNRSYCFFLLGLIQSFRSLSTFSCFCSAAFAGRPPASTPYRGKRRQRLQGILEKGSGGAMECWSGGLDLYIPSAMLEQEMQTFALRLTTTSANPGVHGHGGASVSILRDPVEIGVTSGGHSCDNGSCMW